MTKTNLIIHDSFEVSILIKAFDAALQIVGAVLVLVISPNSINSVVRFLTMHELSHDSGDWIANQFLSLVQLVTNHKPWFAAIYLASHGIVKLFLVYNLWQRRLWAYPAAIVVFILFGLYQIYRYNLTHSIGLIILTILDALVIILTWLEYNQLKKKLI